MRSHHKMPSSYSFYFLEPFSFPLEGTSRGHPAQLPISSSTINCSQGTLLWQPLWATSSSDRLCSLRELCSLMKSAPLLLVFLQEVGICKQMKMELVWSWQKGRYTYVLSKGMQMLPAKSSQLNNETFLEFSGKEECQKIHRENSHNVTLLDTRKSVQKQNLQMCS